MDKFIARVALRAVQIRPFKLLLTLLALPFYVIGLLAGLFVVVVMFAVAGVLEGVADVRSKATPSHGGT